ncbi:MAG TPA: TetR family transcriptional regulator [Solirubrobacteraceae bacterium]|nr:TetR family transcriptional regulator [Solirubrobacteraceae bacterium]
MSARKDARDPAFSRPGNKSLRELQRARILHAAAQAIAQDGYGALSVERIRAGAVVSRATFFELFSDVEDCFLAIVQEAVQRIATVVIPAYQLQDAWPARLHAALQALLEFFEDEPDSGRLLLVHAPVAGPRVRAYRAGVLASLQLAVDQGRAVSSDASVLPELLAEAIVQGALSVLRDRLLQTPPGELRPLLAPLMSLIVTPYLGANAAAEELAREPPKRRRRMPQPRSPEPRASTPEFPLKRVTYRTLSVLEAIGSHPGASSREIANSAGGIDEGQLSKLLARLHNLGLILSSGRTDAGKPHQWRLTDLGEALRRGSSPATQPATGKADARNVRQPRARNARRATQG